MLVTVKVALDTTPSGTIGRMSCTAAAAAQQSAIMSDTRGGESILVKTEFPSESAFRYAVSAPPRPSSSRSLHQTLASKGVSTLGEHHVEVVEERDEKHSEDHP